MTDAREIHGYCDRKFHDGEQVEATMIVMTARVEDAAAPTYAPVDSTFDGAIVRFACCDEDVGRAIAVLKDAGGERFVVRPI